MSNTDWRPPTQVELAEMCESAYEWGLNGTFEDDAGRYDWDEILDVLERTPIDLGDWEDEPVKAIKKAYRRGRKDRL